MGRDRAAVSGIERYSTLGASEGLSRNHPTPPPPLKGTTSPLPQPLAYRQPLRNLQRPIGRSFLPLDCGLFPAEKECLFPVPLRCLCQPATRASSTKPNNRRMRSAGRSRVAYHKPLRERRSHDRGTSISRVM